MKPLPSAESDRGLPGHQNVSFDLTCPRQYTARGGWNRYCECGASLGDTGYSEAEQELLWEMHMRVVRGRITPPDAERPRCPVCHMFNDNFGMCPGCPSPSGGQS